MRLTIIFVFFGLVGCATQGVNTTRYAEPSPQQVQNEVEANAPYSRVWDVLVRDLAKIFYVINSIDKESRIINVSFSTTDPRDFVDCGVTTRTYAEGSSVETFEYQVAGRGSFKYATNRQESPAFTNYAVMSREAFLEGRSNIYVAPVEGRPDKTTVSVDTRYILTTKIKGETFAKHFSGHVFSRGRLPEESTTDTFNTGTVSKRDVGNSPTVICRSKGKLEGDVLDIVRKL